MATPDPGSRRELFRRWDITVISQWLALAAALLPIVTAVVRARFDHWLPLGDNAYFTVRSRDVLTDHHPFIGAWSIGSNTLGTSVNNLGPLQLELMAPFTKLTPYWGTAIAMGVINGLAVVGVWLISRRMLGPVGVIGAMLATICLELTMGGLGLLQARQQFALLIPFWCLLWLAAAFASGRTWALPWLVFVVSLVVQTHFTYIYQTVVIALTAVVSFVVAERHRLRERAVLGSAVLAVGVAVVCWAQPLWDQFFGTGNMGKVIDQAGNGDSDVSTMAGIRLIADTTLLPPFWAPGTMASFIRSRELASTAAAVTGVVLWTAALAGAMYVARRYGRRALGGLTIVGAAAFVSALYAGGAIPPNPRHGLVPQNYYWMWPIGIFLTVTVVAGILTIPAVRSWLRGATLQRVAVGTATATVVAALPGLRATIGWPEYSYENEVARDVGYPLMEQFSAALERYEIDGPLTINATPGDLALRYTMMAELQEHDVDFRFMPGAQHLARFGKARCESADSTWLLTLLNGPPSTIPRPGSILLARVDQFTSSEAIALDRLNRQFGEYIRNGKLRFDTSRLVTFGRPTPQGLERLIDTPGMSASGMAMRLAPWHYSRALQLDDDIGDDFDRWVSLAQAAANEQMSIWLTPNHTPRPDLCDELEPGTLRLDPDRSIRPVFPDEAEGDDRDAAGDDEPIDDAKRPPTSTTTAITQR